MILRPIMILMMIFLGCKMIMSTALAENTDNASSGSVEVSENKMVIDSENNSELSQKIIEKSDTNVSVQKKRSIKMIVGGQSEDGVAKQVTLPVK